MARPTQFDRINFARTHLLDHGVVPTEMLPESIARSWSRCADSGLSLDVRPQISPVSGQELKEIREKNTALLQLALPEIENLQAQLLGTQSMVILTDADGVILHTHGDSDFIDKAQRVALQPGVSWCEENTGTNAIGTALVEQAPVYVMGPEHYFGHNGFLSCSAAPIADPKGRTIGVLDVSGDYRQPLKHTMALVRISAQMIENRLFNAQFSREILLCFHARPEFVGTLWQGMAAFSPDGKLLGVNRIGASLLDVKAPRDNQYSFADIFEKSFSGLLETTKNHSKQVASLRTHSGQVFYMRLETASSGHVNHSARPAADTSSHPQIKQDLRQLDLLDTGDPRIGMAIAQMKKILGRDIPLLIEGETGTGKELFARAYHAANSRKGPFVAVNCAAIPEGIIEAELFGYEGGAFTGARRHGSSGRILQANGGTLFLDEIGEMPLFLQARLLRVLQEREITPLGSAKGIPVDISIVSATNSKLRQRCEAGLFREDLYYRLNGLRVNLPPLRERSDLDVLIKQILEEECITPPMLDAEASAVFRRHVWRGNVRQLRNVLRTAAAFVDDANILTTRHLPADFIEEDERKTEGVNVPDLKKITRIADLETGLIQQALREHSGNVAMAARKLGISRATLYRRLQKLKQS